MASSSPSGSDFSYNDLAGMIDHAILLPQTSDNELIDGIALAVRYKVASVCILPYFIPRCVEQLTQHSAALPHVLSHAESMHQIRSSTVIGFPHGAVSTPAKRFEANEAIQAGCQELDIVVNISRVVSGDWKYVEKDLSVVIEVAHAAQRQVKIIFENCYLNNDQKIHLCRICGELKADWVKTSTGFGTHGATLDDVHLMRAHSPPWVQVKAAGGVRTVDDLIAFRAAGATRIGTSKTAELMDEWRRRLGLNPVINRGHPTQTSANY